MYGSPVFSYVNRVNGHLEGIADYGRRYPTRRTSHACRGCGPLPGQPEDGHPLGPGRQDHRHPHPRRPPSLPGLGDPPLPRAARQQQPRSVPAARVTWSAAAAAPPTWNDLRVPSLALPTGFIAHTGHAGLRDEGDDVAVIVSTRPCTSAGLFTQSRFEGPSVTLSRPRAASGRARAIVVVAKNANVATGHQGLRDAEEITAAVAAAVGVPVDEVLIASTGRDRPALSDGPAAGPPGRPARRPPFDADAVQVARAMMTTDTVAKTAVQQAGPARVVGMAKGVGMIEPDMATMLAFVLTDAAVDAATLRRLWRRAVDDTFNCLSIDTDTSTSDTAAVLANGAAGPVSEADLAAALREVCLDLTLQLARDGEGATKLLTVTVRAAADAGQARRVAKADRQLAAGQDRGARRRPELGPGGHGHRQVPGRPGHRPGAGHHPLRRPRDLPALARRGRAAPPDATSWPPTTSRSRWSSAPALAEATVYGCDLSAGYVRINADYTT